MSFNDKPKLNRPSFTQHETPPMFKGNGAIILTVERKEVTPIKIAKGGTGLSLGQMVDAMLADAVRRRDTIAQVTIDLSDDAWNELSFGSVTDVSTTADTKQD